ncbi:hypothetical protein ASPCADRAFT_210451, partial [Aspergillus carbonarius ITEM 5010]
MISGPAGGPAPWVPMLPGCLPQHSGVVWSDHTRASSVPIRLNQAQPVARDGNPGRRSSAESLLRTPAGSAPHGARFSRARPKRARSL